MAIQFAALISSLGNLTSILSKVGEVVSKGVDLYDESQKASLQLGMSFQQYTNQVRSFSEGLRGGFFQQLEVGFTMLATGLQGNVNQVAELVNTQRITGQNYKKTAEFFAKLNAQGGLQVGALNETSDTLQELSKTYGVSTEQLVASMDGLSKNLELAGLLGITEQMTMLTAQATAKYGPQFESAIQRSVELLSTARTEDLATFSQVGIEMADVIRLQQTGSLQDFERIIAKSSQQIENLGLAGENGSFGASILSKEVVGLAGTINALNNAKPREALDQSFAGVGDMLSVGFKEAIAPFKVILLETGYALKPYITNLSENFRLVGELLRTALRPALMTIGLIGRVMSIFTPILTTTVDILSAFNDVFFAGFATSMGGFDDAIKEAQASIYRWVLSMNQSIQDLLENLPGFDEDSATMIFLKKWEEKTSARLQEISDNTAETGEIATPEGSEFLRSAITEAIARIVGVQTDNDEIASLLRTIRDNTGGLPDLDLQPRLA